VNLLAHAWVALACGYEAPDEVLGAVLPDLASMARVRLDRSRLAPGVAVGVACHLATDEAFHADRHFVTGSAALRRELVDAGVRRGAARAVGHVGWELLLDGTLVGSPAEAAFRDALAGPGVDAVADALDGDGRRRWQAFLDRRGEGPARLRYDDPAWVADRMVAILAPRPALRLGEEGVPAVRAALSRHAGRVTAAAPAVLDATAAAVRARAGTAPPGAP
jgi:hypothetical protein